MDNEEYSVRTGWVVRSTDIDKLAPALVKAQGQIEEAVKGKKNDHFRSKYADLGAVWNACRDALQANDLAVIQLPTKAPPGHIGLRTIIIHKSGQSLSDSFCMPLKDASNPQAAGSALTYARRYALSAAIGICPTDDDGNAAAAPAARQPNKAPPITAQNFMEMFNKAGGPDARKLVYMQARSSSLPDEEKTSLLASMASELMKKGK